MYNYSRSPGFYAEIEVSIKSMKKEVKEVSSVMNLIRVGRNWYQDIWFSNASPKYAFFTWLVAKNRIATGDRMIKWNQNVDASCVFCKDSRETKDHMFFNCPYSRTVWKELVSGLLLNNFTEKWLEIMTMLAKKDLDKTKGFIVRYVFQNTIHSIWRERNDRRHGEQPSPTEKIVKLIDKIP
uniref:Reverse transcriptase n=1 Tax=Arabidopsis lyrata subsp. lyrata TaxID=81972 RepID=B2BXI9_ARALL|nr:reverse transcriptase [Arabidopsis lyrata subsp. lyrata]